jgi:hypothetical protein
MPCGEACDPMARSCLRADACVGCFARDNAKRIASSGVGGHGVELSSSGAIRVDQLAQAGDHSDSGDQLDFIGL